jgi:hypothetical protein
VVFKIYNCDFGIKVGGVKYEFPNVAELQEEDPERNRLTRGSNATDKIGIVYKDGLKDPKRWTLPILNMSAALKAVLDSAFEKQTRVEPYCVDKSDGSIKTMKNAILSNRPRQLALDETAESMNVSLEFESFDSIEVHKS